jgi:hypothetical protein
VASGRGSLVNSRAENVVRITSYSSIVPSGFGVRDATVSRPSL